MRRRRWSAPSRRVVLFAAFAVLVVSPFQPTVAAQDEERVTIPLNEYKNSGVSGTATLTGTDGDTRVVMELRGEPVTGEHPTHIHTGTCADFDPDPTYPLTTVILDPVSDEGVSETQVEGVRLRDLLADDYVVLVHKSAQELTNYYVCGDVKVNAEDGAEDEARRAEESTERGSAGGTDGEGGAGGTARLPGSGVGAAAADEAFPSAVLVGLALLSALAAAGLRLGRGARG